MKEFLLPICSVSFGISAAFSEPDEVKATIMDLYVKKSATQCVALVTTCLFATALSNSAGGIQATIKSNGGTRYTLWEDSNCSTKPVYYQ